MRFLGAVNVVAVGVLWAFAMWAWPRLPDSIPLHFGIDGTPDRWGPPTATNWFLLPTVVVGLNLVIWGVGQWIRRDPTKVNLPGGQRMDELPAPAKEAVLRLMAATLSVVQLLMNAVFILIQAAQYNAAMGEPAGGLLGGVLFVSLFSGPVFLVVYFLRLQKALAAR